MITKGKEAKEKILDGINDAVDIAKISLGAKGKTVVLRNKYLDSFRVTKDGISILKDVHFEDDLKEVGAGFIKNSSNKTVEEAGDGTTTTAILTQSMCNSIFKELELGVNANELIKDLKNDLEVVKNIIKDNSRKVEDTEAIKNIAKISANNDDEIGELLKSIYDEAGMEVAIDISESDHVETSYEIVNGLTMKETGYASPQFINNPDKGRVEFNNPRIYLLNGKVRYITDDLGELLQGNADRNSEDFRPLVIIVEDIEEAPLREIVMATGNKFLHNVAIVQTNLIYEDRKNAFIDSSVFLNAEYNEERLTGFGECEKIVIEKHNVTFINGSGDVKKHLEKLKKLQKKDNNISIDRRIFSLQSKAAIINVGGKLGTEIDEKKDRIEDSVHAVKSAIEEGYCPGGSTVYLFARLKSELKTNVMKKALLSCYQQLMKNAELEAFYYLKEITDAGFGYGYNLIKDKITNFYDDGIYDSAKVLRVSLENAVHTACNFALIEGVIS